ncbi:uncharacterized protein LOC123310199 [Coccinella septempunctata]|uniref:uncharacterized protein LOC123310199 n=1 Tax=Coccinella septempunctata TaxID=41139 RepID=UPI001D080D62|nr:uncharacterized protein LOC123310199 [Coccinella septempunctata]
MSQRNLRNVGNLALVDEAILECVLNKLAPRLTAEIVEKTNKIEGKIDGINERLTDVLTQLSSLKEKVDIHEQNIEKINSKVEKIQRSFIENSITIAGIEEENDENLLCKVISFFKDTMGVQCNTMEVNKAYRIGKKTEGRIRIIVVVFVTQWKRNMVYGARTTLRKTNFYINENLTEKTYKLLLKAKEIHVKQAASPAVEEFL